MKNEEAKFILAAFRPDGRDAHDATFGPALGQTESDPEMRKWFEKQRAFDTALAAKLHEIKPPAGLREAILTGSRVSFTAKPKRSWWQHPTWLAAAAAVMIVAAIGVVQRSGSRPTAAELTAFALHDLANAHTEHIGNPPALAALQAELASARLPLTSSLSLNLEDLRKQKCRSIKIEGRELFEVCFQRDGTWFHVYVGRRQDFAPGSFSPGGLMNVDAQFAATAWADNHLVYALVTHAGAEALRRVI